MGGVDDELGDEVLFAGLHAEAAGASAPLLAVDGDGRALEVAGVGDGDGNLLVGDEVFELELGGLVDDVVRRASPYLSRISVSSLTMTLRSFLFRQEWTRIGDVVADFG